MKSFTLFSTLAAAASLLSVAALPVYPLEARAPSFFHRTCTLVAPSTARSPAGSSRIYKKGQHPASHTTVPGDFSHSGALYVFEEAKLWGSCWAKVRLKAENKKYYLVKFKYTPNPGLKTLALFTSGDNHWKEFVDSSYKKAGAHYDTVEGPISGGHGAHMQAYVNAAGHLVLQGVFIGANALKTLTVEEVILKNEQPSSMCPVGCNIE